ncbi:MAG: DUF2878 domain-containing protein [Endozoicomonas sp. (ex Botrylloides leachii)]|nr:DUF2878 domain-containing protein [Endozoicomonas sp. (ex Botrylloides leachii)]
MTSMPWKRIINALLFQAGWFICVLGGNTLALISTVLIVTIHVIFITEWKKERELLFVTLVLGSAVDSFLGNIGVLSFYHDSLLLPLWLACLWLLFATTLRHCLAWTGRHKLAGALVGAIAGPMSYYAGSQLSNVELSLPLWKSMLILSVIWAMMIPLLQSFSAMWLDRYQRDYPNIIN